jgi:FkbM family methyltransferase
VFFSLADDASRAHYVQFLAWRKLRVELLFSGLEINNNNRFFIPEVLEALREDEIFIDCGAHHGSVTEKFLKFVSNKYKAIIAIEPDNINFETLKTKLEGSPNINLMKCALGDRNGQGKFYQGFDFASKLSDVGNDMVKIITLDSLNISGTFIKMHLEGGDLKALIGAIKTVQQYRPIVAVTIYHNADGVWETPFFLMNNTSNYQYYMRLHSWGGTGAVFYAIPEEKK